MQKTPFLGPSPNLNPILQRHNILRSLSSPKPVAKTTSTNEFDFKRLWLELFERNGKEQPDDKYGCDLSIGLVSAFQRLSAPQQSLFIVPKMAPNVSLQIVTGILRSPYSTNRSNNAF